MIICPQCTHQNTDEAIQCEACLSELPQESSCPNCGTHNLKSAKFCGCCGYSLTNDDVFLNFPGSAEILQVPEPEPPEPIIELSPQPTFLTTSSSTAVKVASNIAIHPTAASFRNTHSDPDLSHNQIQGSLTHQGTQFKFLLDAEKSEILIGKPNNRVSPDINLETLKHSEVVSRIHAKILIQENLFYLQDEGSANGTFVNHIRITAGEKKLLKPGDQISLGKGNLVAFTFELS